MATTSPPLSPGSMGLSPGSELHAVGGPRGPAEEAQPPEAADAAVALAPEAAVGQPVGEPLDRADVLAARLRPGLPVGEQGGRRLDVVGSALARVRQPAAEGVLRLEVLV